GAWWVQRPMWDRIFGQLDDVNAYIRATQFIQFDGLRYALEADRRRKFHNSGTLPWQFNEPYPMAACTSAVDYYGQPKPVYYAVAKAYEPIHVSARFDGITCAGSPHFLSEIWICNSLTQDVTEAELTVRLVGASGRSYHQLKTRVSIGANQARRLCVFDYDFNTVESVFFLDILLNALDDELLSENRYIFTRTENLSILLGLPETNLSVVPIYKGDIWEMEVRNEGAQAAVYVWLQDDREIGSTGYVYFDQNYFCLFPGESRRVRVEWQSVDRSHRGVEIGGWNTPGLVINGRG
ncbi:MAG: hypothetical protein JW726_07175, partial [Anaerolineales bacterium]|nr:hypothetical protein [Anaerolineales bacterium]